MAVTVIVDALWGDSGKGKISAYLAKRLNPLLAVRAGAGTNAGASVWLPDDRLIRARQLPTSWLNPTTHVAVGSGTLVDPEVFKREVREFELEGRAWVDGRCAIITPEYIEAEKHDAALAEKVGSTCTGNGYARADFALRRATQAKDVPELQPYVRDVALAAYEASQEGEVIIQGAQGTFLSLALSHDYPNTTSVNCTATAALNDAGLAWRPGFEVVMVVKALPTRVGNGYLPYEMTEDEVVRRGWAERGVVTGRVRRKASQIDWNLLAYAAMLNQPTQIALTFCDHYDEEMMRAIQPSEIPSRVRELIEQVEHHTKAPVTMVDTGKYLDDIIVLT